MGTAGITVWGFCFASEQDIICYIRYEVVLMVKFYVGESIILIRIPFCPFENLVLIC